MEIILSNGFNPFFIKAVCVCVGGGGRLFTPDSNEKPIMLRDSIYINKEWVLN